MDQALATVRAIATVLGLCDQCENKLTGGDSSDGRDGAGNARRSTPKNDILYTKSTLDGVRIKDCDMQNVQIKNCKLTDVTFEKCRLKDVILDGLELNGFTFYNLDLTKVRVKDNTVPGYIWSHQSVENACADRHAFICTDGCTITASKHLGSRSKTVIHHSMGFSDGLGVAPTSNTNPASTRGTLYLVDMPEDVLDSIVSFVLPPSVEQDHIYVVSMSTTRQCTQTIWKPRPDTLATYHIDLGCSFTKSTAAAPAGLLLTDKKCNTIATKHLYTGRLFIFGAASTCLAFLHDHRAPKLQLQKLGVFLTPSSDPAA